MQRPGHSRVILDLAIAEEPICGWVQAGEQPPRQFTGWLSLSAALDGARQSADRQAPGRGEDVPVPSGVAVEE
ncbi:MAG TPA: hypothetical protein VFN65_05930 [Solirubrobacteraceae bacterium]|nr:hypothetical protein [Solirubrobacteraceae bacterium]